MNANHVLAGSALEPVALESITTDWGLLSLLAVGISILLFLIWFFAFEPFVRLADWLGNRLA